MIRALPSRILMGLVLAMGYVNCSGPGFSTLDQAAQQSSQASSQPSPAVPLDTSGKITAYQDRLLRAGIPGAAAGATYSLSGAPSWLSVDAASGELRGVPPAEASLADIRITITKGGASTTVGPYSLTVHGDPLKEQQWALGNKGQKAFAGLAGTAGQDIHLTESVKQGLVGEGITIAISDSGVEETHRGLSPNLLSGASRNYLLNYDTTGSWSGSATPDTSQAEHAHGTAVAGLIVERGWDGHGGRGVAPSAKWAGFLYIQAQEFLSTKGHSTPGLLDQFAGEFDIFNYSWGDPQCAFIGYGGLNYDQKLKNGAETLRGGKGALYVKAAGNQYWDYLDACHETAASTAYFLGNANFSEEATTPYTILVGALNADGTVTSYSTPGANIWISAPGGETGLNKPTNATVTAQKPAMVTTDFSGCSKGLKTFSGTQSDFNRGQSPNSDCEHVSTMNGTSSASPIVAGSLALILNANPSLTWREVKHIIAATADKVDPSRGASNHPVSAGNLSGHTYEQGWITNAAGFPFHNWYGFGRINVDKAVAMAKAGGLGWGPQKQTNSGSTWTYDSGSLGLNVPGGDAAGVSRTLSVTQNLVIEAVQIRVKAANCIGGLGIELTSPSGTKSILMNINSYLLDEQINSHVFLSNAFYGEQSTGTWTLKLIAAKSGCASTWNSWQLNIIGR